MQSALQQQLHERQEGHMITVEPIATIPNKIKKKYIYIYNNEGYSAMSLSFLLPNTLIGKYQYKFSWYHSSLGLRISYYFYWAKKHNSNVVAFY